MSGFRTLVIASTIALAAALTGCFIISSSDDGGGGGDSTLTLHNSSSFVITSIQVAHVDNPDWGPNLLPGRALHPGEELLVTNIDCGTYDVRVVDETGVDCELHGIELCFSDEVWTIDDTMLDTCAFNPVRSRSP